MTEGRQNLTPAFFKAFNTAGYLSPVRTIGALMTFEHQTQMANFLTRLGWEARHRRRGTTTIPVRIAIGYRSRRGSTCFLDERR